MRPPDVYTFPWEGNMRSSALQYLARLSVLLTPVLTCAASAQDPATEAPPSAIVAPFEASRYQLANHTEACRSQLEDLLVNKGVHVVERTQLAKIIKEQGIGRNRSFSDPETAVEAGKALGANVIVLGTIIDINVQSTTTMQGTKKEKVRKTTVLTKGSVRVRVIDVATTKVSYSRILDAGVSVESSKAEKNLRDPSSDVMREAIEKLSSDGAFLKAVGARRKPKSANDTIEVTFDPTPEGCDVLINGEYRGPTPLKLKLPAKLVAEVLLRKPGYLPWEAKIIPSSEMTEIKPTLEERSP